LKSDHEEKRLLSCRILLDGRTPAHSRSQCPTRPTKKKETRKKKKTKEKKETKKKKKMSKKPVPARFQSSKAGQAPFLTHLLHFSHFFLTSRAKTCSCLQSTQNLHLSTLLSESSTNPWNPALLFLLCFGFVTKTKKKRTTNVFYSHS
jgi:hypothetical protein